MTSAVVACYRALVRLLPAELREAHGDELVALFCEDWRVTQSRGVTASAALFCRSAWDVIVNAPRQHWRLAARGSQEESLHTFWSDLRFAARSFARQRGSTMLVMLTLTLAVAANTGVFTLLDGLFLRPVPFKEPGRLVYLNETAPKWNLHYTGVNYPDFDAWRKGTHSFEAMGAINTGSFNLSTGNTADRVQGAQVTWDLLATLGLKPVIGRGFTADEDRPHGPNVVMLGYGFWQSRYAGAKDVIGRSIRLEATEYTIIGVLPREAEFPGGVQLWIPLGDDVNATCCNYSHDGIGRLKPGVTLAQARADLLKSEEPIWRLRDTAHVVSPVAVPLSDWVIGDFRTAGQILGFGVVIVLLIACANVGGAMLARATFRKRELAIRVALGASRRRIARQVFTESLLLAVVAGVVGTALGWWGVRALTLAAADQLPGWVHLDFSIRVAAFGALIIGVITVLFGAMPVLEARRAGVGDAMGSGDLRSSASRRQRRTLDALVVIEIALASILLVSGGLLVRAFNRLQHVDPGFNPTGVAQFRIAPPLAAYSDGNKQRRLYETVMQRLATIPGVTSAAAISCPPFTCHWGNFYQAEGTALKPGGENPVVLTRIAAPDYYRTMGIEFVHGRAYTAAEQRKFGELFPLVVNEEFAKLHWPGIPDPVGKRVSFNGPDTDTWMTVVGVVKDVKHYGLAEPMRPGIYMPMSFMDSTRFNGSMAFVVKTTADASALVTSIRSAMREIDPELPLYQVRTMQQALTTSLAGRRTLMMVLASFGAIALTLSVSGIYAVLSYVVGRRRREIGIRIALGAQRKQVVAMVVGQGLRLIVVGLLIGLPVTLLGTRILSSMLAGIANTDFVTYAGVGVLLATTGIIAAFAPARRAAAVDPRRAIADA